MAGITGTPGSSNNTFNTPFYATVDYQNTLYVADLYNNRIQKFLMGSSYGTTVCGDGTAGSSSNRLSWPAHVLVDSNGILRVTEVANERVQLFYPGTTSGTMIAGFGQYEFKLKNFFYYLIFRFTYSPEPLCI